MIKEIFKRKEILARVLSDVVAVHPTGDISQGHTNIVGLCEDQAQFISDVHDQLGVLKWKYNIKDKDLRDAWNMLGLLEKVPARLIERIGKENGK